MATTNRAVKTSCKNTKVRTAAGACAPERKPMMKSGGTSPFGILSIIAGIDNNPGKSKADRIAGAKMKAKGNTKKVIPKAQDGIITDTTKYRPWSNSNVKPTLIKPPHMDPRETLRLEQERLKLEQLKLDQKERLKGNQDNYKINKSTGKMEYAGPKSTVKKLGGATHPGFKAVQSKIAAKQGVSKQAAGAILAASTRKASAKAKAKNPRLKRVKG
jgi:hypothetical protein